MLVVCNLKSHWMSFKYLCWRIGKMQKQHRLVVKEAIIKVEAGEISYKDFFDIALRRNNNG